MGSGMASRLLSQGYEVAIYNRTAERAKPLVAAGARLAVTPRAACEGVHAVISMTADDVSSRAMWLGDDGALAAELAPRTLTIECSTVSHEWVMTLARHAAERGCRYIDAPVTGLPAAAAAGELTLLVGADEADLDAAKPLLNALSTKVVHFGPVGAGTAYKLAVNLIGAVQIASAAEGLALAERAGLDLRLVADAIATGQAASPQVVRNTRRMARRIHARRAVHAGAAPQGRRLRAAAGRDPGHRHTVRRRRARRLRPSDRSRRCDRTRSPRHRCLPRRPNRLTSVRTSVKQSRPPIKTPPHDGAVSRHPARGDLAHTAGPDQGVRVCPSRWVLLSAGKNFECAIVLVTNEFHEFG